MRRLFWLAMGITIGVLVVRKASKTAEQLSPDHLASKAGNALGEIGQSMRSFATEVRTAMSEREEQLREGVGLDGKLGAKAEDFKK